MHYFPYLMTSGLEWPNRAEFWTKILYMIVQFGLEFLINEPSIFGLFTRNKLALTPKPWLYNLTISFGWILHGCAPFPNPC